MTAVWYSAAPLFARRGARRAYPAGKERRIFRGEALRAFPLIFLRPPVLSDCGGLSRKGRAAVRCGSRQTPVPGGLAGGIRTGYRIGWNDILWDSSYRMIAYSQKIIYLQAVTVVCIRTEAAQEAILRPASY